MIIDLISTFKLKNNYQQIDIQITNKKFLKKYIQKEMAQIKIIIEKL